MWYLSSSYRDSSEPLVVCQGCEASFLVARDTLGYILSRGRGIKMPLELRWEIQSPVSFATGILGFVSIFKGNPSSSHVEAWKTSLFSSWKWGVSPHVNLRRGSWAFSRTTTGSQTSHSVVSGNSEFHSSHFHGTSPSVELRETMMSFCLTEGTLGSFSSFNR